MLVKHSLSFKLLVLLLFFRFNSTGQTIQQIDSLNGLPFPTKVEHATSLVKPIPMLYLLHKN